MPSSGITGSYGSSISSCLRNRHTVLHSGCTSLHPTNSVRGFPFLHTLSSFIACRLLGSSHSDWREMRTSILFLYLMRFCQFKESLLFFLSCRALSLSWRAQEMFDFVDYQDFISMFGWEWCTLRALISYTIGNNYNCRCKEYSVTIENDRLSSPSQREEEIKY